MNHPHLLSTTVAVNKSDQSEAVKALQDALEALGYCIPEKEHAQGTFWEGTLHALQDFQSDNGLPLTEMLDSRTMEEINKKLQPLVDREASGRVLYADGKPVVEAEVRVLDKNLKDEKEIKRVKTDGQGNFQVIYTLAGLHKTNAGANLRVEVWDKTTDKKLTESTQVRYNAGVVEVFRFTVGEAPPPPSEYENLLEKIRPALSGAALEDIDTPEEEDFLIKATRLDAEKVHHLVTAARQAKSSGFHIETWYALLSQLPQLDPDKIGEAEPKALEDAIKSAVSRNVVRKTLESEMLKDITKKLVNNKVDAVLAPVPDGKTPSAGDYFRWLFPREDKKVRKAAKIYLDHPQLDEVLYTTLDKGGFTQTEVQQLRNLRAMANIVVEHGPLMKILAAKTEYVSQPNLLATIKEQQWKAWVRRANVGVPDTITGKDEEQRIASYLKTIRDNIASAYTTSLVRHTVTAASSNIFKHEERSDLKIFFDRYPHFDLTASGSVDTFFEKEVKKDPNFTDVDGLKHNVRMLKAFTNLGIEPPHLNTLRDAGVRSSFDIARTPRAEFVRSMGPKLGGFNKASGIYDRATNSHLTGMILYTAVYDNLFGVDTNVLSTVTLSPTENGHKADSNRIPDWRTLFGSIDRCNCKECESVFGLAAYFVDIMRFLHSCQGRAYQKLMERRPDLEYLELTCANSHTEMPYIDLVNEILENAVIKAPKAIFIPTNLRGLENVDWANAKSVSIAGKRITDLKPLIGSTAEGTNAWLQTTRDKDELKAQPEHLNKAAYEILKDKTTVYPWNLPFHLANEEARTYLGHLGINRAAWMEEFSFPPAAKGTKREKEIAAEYLGLDPEDVNVITGTSNLQDWEYWGFEHANPPHAINNPNPTHILQGLDWDRLLKRRVDVFLQQSGLTYKELLQLLATYFINPETGNNLRKLNLVATGLNLATCQLDELEIKGLDTGDLDRIHRFVRLSRRSNWSFYELDKAIMALQPKNPAGALDLTSDFLVGLSEIKRIQKLLDDADFESVLTFFADISNLYYYDFDASPQKETPSQYERLFRNRKLMSNNTADLTDFPFPEDPANLKGNLTDEKTEPVLLSALGIATDDLKLLYENEVVFPVKVGINIDLATTLAHLSELYRYSKLAKLLHLSVEDLLNAIELAYPQKPGPQPKDPFYNSAEALVFIKWVQRIQGYSLSMTELIYLLRHRFRPESPLQPGEEEIVGALEELRSGLQKIRLENSSTEDTTGDVLASKLALIGWEKQFVDEVVALLKGNSVPFETPWPALAVNLLPSPLPARLRYDKAEKLVFSGLMTNNDRAELKKISGNTVFEGIVDEFRHQAEAILEARLRTFMLPTFEQTFPKIPEIELPVWEIKNNTKTRWIEYDPVTKRLELQISNNATKIGALTDDEKGELLTLSTDVYWQSAVERLANDNKKPFRASLQSLPKVEIPANLKYRVSLDTQGGAASKQYKIKLTGGLTQMERTQLEGISKDAAFIKAVKQLANDAAAYTAPAETVFLSPDAIQKLLQIENPADRFRLLLRELLPYLTNRMSTEFILQKSSETLGVGLPELTELNVLWKKSSAKVELVQVFKDPDFVNSDVKNEIDEAAFPDQFERYILLNKLALWVNKLKLKAIGMKWLVDAGAQASGCFDLFKTPTHHVAMTAATSYLEALEVLLKLLEVRDSLPDTDTTLNSFFTLANLVPPSADYEKKVAELTKWNEADFNYLTGTNGLNFTTRADIQDGKNLWQLYRCLGGLKRTGIKAEYADDLAKPDLDLDESVIAVHAVRAKYDDKSWPEVAVPLQDVLRERKRDALIAYLIAHPEKTGKIKHRDSKDLFSYFLIDVEMGACMNTSRLRQAALSVQLYIQRCQMHLEDGLSLTSCESKKWNEWMKYYRVWEANRQIFIYPENWIEPDLRDDKTPFFKELENDLLQNDLNNDTAETAFANYLEKLDQVAKLEIVAMCWEDRSPTTAEDCVFLEEQKTNAEVYGPLAPIKILHVFGRTPGIPHTYYHRQLMPEGIWTPWERVDLDIEGDHLIPVVWNRRLYLFWPMFMEKSDTKANKKAGNDAKVSYYYYEIKMARSEYRNGKWVAKKISKSPFVTPTYELNEEVGKPDNKVVLKDFSFLVKNKKNGEVLDIVCYGPNEAIPTAGQQGHSDQPDINFNKVNLFPYTNNQKIFWIKGIDELGINDITITGIDSANTKQPAVKTGPFDSNQNGFPEIMVRLSNAHLLNQGFAKVNGFDSYEITSKSNDYIISKIRITHQIWYYGLLDNDMYSVVDDFDYQNGIFSSKTTDDNFYRRNLVGIWEVLWSLFVPALGNNPYLGNHQADNKLGEVIEIYLEKKKMPEVINVTESKTLGRFELMGAFKMLSCNGEIIPSNESGQTLSSPFYNVDPGLFRTFIEGNLIKLFTTINGFGNNYSVTPAKLFASGGFVIFNIDHIFLIATTQIEDKGEFSGELPLFFQDDKRVYFLSKVREGNLQINLHYHPYACSLINSLKVGAAKGLLTLENQMETDNGFISLQYSPMGGMAEQVEFSKDGAYSIYNWELFFHAPFEIAVRLSKNQKFEEAQQWFHYIFDPTTRDAGGKEKFWRFKPFHEESLTKKVLTIDDLFQKAQALQSQVIIWSNNPFKPHALARVRPVAYMKAVVMRYLDNLLEWGDQLYHRDTRESLMEATQLYILALQILGRKPDEIPQRAKPEVATFADLKGKTKNLDAFGNFQAEIDGWMFPSMGPSVDLGSVEGVFVFNAPEFAIEDGTPIPSLFKTQMPYFCIPQNEILLEYWEKLEERLFKIRHCMNIEGVVREMPLFEPPIDPALLVRAAAAGVDLSSVLNDMNAPLPHYRFNFMAQKAMELVNEVKSLGGALLSALEKRDAEEIALLRSKHEIQMLQLTRDVRRSQLEEAMRNKEGLEKSKESSEAKILFYSTREYMNLFESAQLVLTMNSIAFSTAQINNELLAGVSHLIPNVKAGAPFTAGSTYGGANIASGSQAFGSAKGTAASILNALGSLSATQGGYQRRSEEWAHQLSLAQKEQQQLMKQLVAADIRIAIAEKELNNHEQQMENAKAADEVMHSKFSNKELYNWMVGQISGVYFQAYKMAYDLAKRAERCYQHELGEYESNYLQFGYWDSLNKGLFAAEKLAVDLKKLESAYYEKNKREFELTKHVSLSLLNPMAITQLKINGQCEIDLPEWLFDLDYPGHYFRRVKSVSISIPCVAGPYTTINCTLRLMRSTVRMKSTLRNGKYERDEESGSDNRFRDDYSVQSIATSSAQNDSGLFELNFRDERYLPFEGAGAVSRWRIELNEEFRQFDYNTITDIVMHLKFTAREAGGLLKGAANKALKDSLKSSEEGKLVRLVSLHQEYSTEFNKYRNGTGAMGDLKFNFDKSRLPFLAQGQGVTATVVQIDILSSQDISAGSLIVTTVPTTGATHSSAQSLIDAPKIGAIFHHKVVLATTGLSIADNGQEWKLKGIPSHVKEIYMVVSYKIDVKKDAP